MPMTVDMRGLFAAMREKEAVSKYTGAEVVNMAAKTILVGSSSGQGLVQLTRKATKARIRSDMQQMVTAKIHKTGKTHTIPRVIALAARFLSKRGESPKNGSRAEMDAWRAKIKAACERIIAEKIQSRAYIAAGWLHATKDLVKFLPPGQKFTRLNDRNLPMRYDASAAQSFTVPASGNNPTCYVYNTSKGAEVVVTQDVYQNAIDNTVHDIGIYLARQYGKAMGAAFKKSLR